MRITKFTRSEGQVSSPLRVIESSGLYTEVCRVSRRYLRRDDTITTIIKMTNASGTNGAYIYIYIHRRVGRAREPN